MSVVADLDVDAKTFELGRIFSAVDSAMNIEVEFVASITGTFSPLVWITSNNHGSLADEISTHPTVSTVDRIEHLRERSLYAIIWTLEYDHLFRYIRDEEIHMLAATGTSSTWKFTLRFRTHQLLSAFHEYCKNSQIDIDVQRVYNTPEQPDNGAFGISTSQREALVLAVREGYYDLPRECSTQELADQLGISDQAVSERLRRAVATLTRNTLITDQM